MCLLFLVLDWFCCFVHNQSSTMPDSESLVAAPEAFNEPPTAIRKVERTQILRIMSIASAAWSVC
jgi:hypothetical protein